MHCMFVYVYAYVLCVSSLFFNHVISNLYHLVLQLSEKIYKNLDKATKLLRFTLPFPMLAYPFYLVNNLLQTLYLLFHFFFPPIVFNLLASFSNVSFLILCGDAEINYSGVEVPERRVLILTQTVTCSFQMKGKTSSPRLPVGLQWLLYSGVSPM